jgi:hypothetical protein
MKRLTLTAIAAVAALGVTPASAAFIDFEGGVDDQEITPSTFSDTGISFVGASGVGLFFEQTGDDETDGFFNNRERSYDEAAAGHGASLGTYFMRTGENVSSRGLPLDVFSVEWSYRPRTPVSGQIWDIDGDPSQGTEQWAVRAYDASDVMIAEQISPLGDSFGAGSLDAKPWTFSFDGSGYDLTSLATLKFSFIGTKETGIGLAFDNFDSGAPVPLPAAAWFLMTAIGGLLGARWLRGGAKA